MALALPCQAQPVTAEDVLRAETPEHHALRDQMRYVVGLVSRLQATDSPGVILDVIELQLRASIDLGLSDKLDHLMAAASQLAAVAGDPARAASIDEQIARSLVFTGRDVAGRQASERALARQEAVLVNGKHPDPTRLFRHLIDHAQLVGFTVRVDTLVTTLKRAEKILPTVRNPGLAALERDNLTAHVYIGLGDLGQAREILASMLDRANQLALHDWKTDVQFLLADTYLSQANYVEAAALSQRALDGYQQQDNQVGIGNAVLQLAQIANASDAPAQAHSYAQRAVRIFDQLDDASAKADARRELAFAAALMGNASAARALLPQILSFRAEDTSANWTYEIARLRTRIAMAENDVAAARRALQREDRLREQREAERGQRHTRATRELFEVGERDLRLQLLQRDYAIQRLDNQRDEAQIALQRWWITGGFLLFAISLMAAALLYRRSIALKRAANTDSLTQVMSRAAILRHLQRALDRAKSSKEVTAVIMLDIDRFKSVNDTYGHSAGDAVLKRCASTISSLLLPGHAIGRLGGDEFMVVMPDTSRDGAKAQAVRIMDALRNMEVVYLEQTLRIAASMGVANSDDNGTANGTGLTQLVHAADAALLAAKQAGRDRVVVTASDTEFG